MYIDDAPRYENILNIYFRLIMSMAEDIRRYGFRNIAQVSWKGREAWRYEPSWRKGGYEVIVWDRCTSILRSAKNPRAPPLTFSNFTFLLKYYPHPDEEVFENFSIREQLVRLSACFNEEEKFPSQTCLNDLHESFFVVGTLNLSANEDVGVLRLALQSQDRFTSILEENLEINGATLREAEEADRNVPGWQLSWEFYRNLLDLYTAKLGRPWLILAVAEPGAIWRCRGERCEAEESASTLLKTIEAVYVAMKDLQVINLIDEAVEETINTLKSKQPRIYANSIKLPYIKVILKDDNFTPDELVFSDVSAHLSKQT